MTTYIEEKQFRGCITNTYPPYPILFTPQTSSKQQDIIVNPDYINRLKSSVSLGLLLVAYLYDTWHDLTKSRGVYDPVNFINTFANYFVTGVLFFGNYIKYYKDNLIYQTYHDGVSDSTSSSYENKVANSLETEANLKRALVSITYDEIIQHFIINSDLITGKISGYLKGKVIDSQGSINLLTDYSDQVSFEKYSSALEDDQSGSKIEKLTKIAYFLRWFLHSPDSLKPDFLKDREDTDIEIPAETMKMLMDGGTLIMGFGQFPGSKLVPYLTVATITDSAGTSINPLDPNEGIDYELFYGENVVPIVSNYFSCNDIFIGYIPNPGKKFGEDGCYCFSLVIFKIPQEPESILYESKNIKISELQETNINTIFNNPQILSQKDTTAFSNADHFLWLACQIYRMSQLDSQSYQSSLYYITSYINTFPNSIARYYFGEVEKDFKTNNLSKCGTSGQGVAFTGKLFDLLLTCIKEIQKGTAGTIANSLVNKKIPLLAANTQPVSEVKLTNLRTEFNKLKNYEKLQSRIPMGDSRILNIFTDFSNNFANINENSFLLLSKLYADGKRCGDYQQAYALLLSILRSTGGVNIHLYTSVSGDELSALIARLLGNPTILQNPGLGKLSLYRCDKYAPNQEAVAASSAIKTKQVTLLFLKNTIQELIFAIHFIETYYTKICALCSQLITVYSSIETQIANKPNNPQIVFNSICLLQSIFLLYQVIDAINSIETMRGTTDATLLSNLNIIREKMFTKSVNNSGTEESGTEESVVEGNETYTLKPDSDIDYNSINELLKQMTQFPILTLKSTVQLQFPQIQFDSTLGVNDNGLFNPIDTTKGSIMIPNLGLKIVKGINKNKPVVDFFTSLELYSNKVSRRVPARTSLVNGYWSEIQSLSLKIIQTFNTFTNNLIMPSANDIDKNDFIITIPNIENKRTNQLPIINKEFTKKTNKIILAYKNQLPPLDQVCNNEIIQTTTPQIKSVLSSFIPFFESIHSFSGGSFNNSNNSNNNQIYSNIDSHIHNDHIFSIQKGGLKRFDEVDADGNMIISDSLRKDNIIMIYETVKNLIFDLITKCNNYITDVIKNPGTKKPIENVSTRYEMYKSQSPNPLSQSTIEWMDLIYQQYDITSFCDTLLNENNNIILQLELLAGEFTFGQLFNENDINTFIRNGFLNNVSYNDIKNINLTIGSLLYFLDLRSVKIILFMLGFNSYDESSSSKKVILNIDDNIFNPDNGLPFNIDTFFTQLPNNVQDVCIQLSNPNNDKLQLFTIICLAILSFFYNNNLVSFDNNFVKEFLNKSSVSNVAAKNLWSESSLIILGNTYNSLQNQFVNVIVNKLASFIGIQPTNRVSSIRKSYPKSSLISYRGGKQKTLKNKYKKRKHQKTYKRRNGIYVKKRNTYKKYNFIKTILKTRRNE